MLEDQARRAEWHRYYSDKRIGQQWKQFDLVGRYHQGGAILEIGPNLGLVTACLVNAGYSVETLDLDVPQFAAPAVRHISADLRTLDPELIGKYDTILCCEMLEHIGWDETDGVLARLPAHHLRPL
jgi:2-polyprenyl-3-methyl-5-hydroxy-6-metoxy-1,4-benzoquinol methylase